MIPKYLLHIAQLLAVLCLLAGVGCSPVLAAEASRVSLTPEERRWLAEYPDITPETTQALLKKWYDKPVMDTDKNQVDLTAREKKWIAEHPGFTTGAVDIPPYIIQKRDGRVTGYFADLLRTISSQVGLHPNFMFTTTSELMEKVEKGQVELIQGVIWNEERARRFNFSPFKIPLHMAIFGRDDLSEISGYTFLPGKRIASFEDYGMHEHMARHIPDARFVMADDGAQMLKLVSRGGADTAIHELYSGRYMIRSNYLNNLEVKGFAQFPGLEDLKAHAYMIRKDLPVLESILTKSYNVLSEAKKKQIWERWFGPEENDLKAFSREEQEWMKKHHVLRFGFDPAWVWPSPSFWWRCWAAGYGWRASLGRALALPLLFR